MPLRLTLRPHEKVFLGGAVIVNGDARTELTLLNDVAVLRQSDILNESTADTPCKRLYLLVQLMYMDTPNLADYHAKFWSHAQTVVNEIEGAEELVGAIGQEVALGNYYRGLKIGKKLIATEEEFAQNGQ